MGFYGRGTLQLGSVLQIGIIQYIKKATETEEIMRVLRGQSFFSAFSQAYTEYSEGKGVFTQSVEMHINIGAKMIILSTKISMFK